MSKKFILLIYLCFFSGIIAAEPLSDVDVKVGTLYSIEYIPTPLTPVPKVVLSQNLETLLLYKITNNTLSPRVIQIENLAPAIILEHTQSVGYCNQLTYLNPKASCIAQFRIIGAELKNPISSEERHPRVFESQNDFAQASRPSGIDSMDVRSKDCMDCSLYFPCTGTDAGRYCPTPEGPIASADECDEVCKNYHYKTAQGCGMQCAGQWRAASTEGAPNCDCAMLYNCSTL